MLTNARMQRNTTKTKLQDERGEMIPPTGSRDWRWEYRFAGKRKTLTDSATARLVADARAEIQREASAPLERITSAVAGETNRIASSESQSVTEDTASHGRVPRVSRR
jgi:hypothetical protein